MGKHRALPTPGWIEGRSVDIGAGEARSAQPYSQPFKFLKEKLTCNPLFSEGLQVGLRPLSGVPKGTRAVGWGDGQKNPGAGGSAPKGFGWVYECGI